MSRQVDTLFCKIAITAGMVSQQQAQKVLAFIEKREQETGRRPLIAAVFTKHQILTAQQTQQVKAAVAKRLGQAAPVPGRVPSGRGRKARREKPARRPVDQQTLIMGAGFGVVFVGVLITICYLFLFSGGSEVASDGSNQQVTRDGSPETRMGSTDPETELPPVPEDKDLPRETVQDINERLSDILLDRIDNPARARSSLETIKAFLEERRGRGYIIPADIEARLSDTEQGLVDFAVDDAPPVGEAPATDATPVEGAKEPPVEVDSGDDEDDLDLDDLDLDDLEDLDDF